MPCFKKTEFEGVSLVRDMFIETGTYVGTSLESASWMGFQEIHSCEVVPKYAKDAQAKFANDPRIHVHEGSSPDILPLIIDPQRATTFWLDAHYQAGLLCEQDAARGECPVLDELKIIFGYEWAVRPYVIIDDSNMFVEHRGVLFHCLYKETQWCTLQQILDSFPPGYAVFNRDDSLWCLPSEQISDFLLTSPMENRIIV